MLMRNSFKKNTVLEKCAVQLVLITAVAGLTSCSSALTKKDCQEKNYYEMGFNDGKDGKTAERLQKVTTECNTLGVQAAAPQYGYGREAGLETYRAVLAKRLIDKQDDLKDIQAVQANSAKENAQITSELQKLEEQKAIH